MIACIPTKNRLTTKKYKMKRIDLIKINHQTKIGDLCEYRTPNVLEDSIFYEDGKPIGFYLTKLTDKGCKLAET